MQEITLKKFRKLLRLTQEEMGDKLGYKGGYISILESGEREFSDTFIEKLNKTFQLEGSGFKLVRKIDGFALPATGKEDGKADGDGKGSLSGMSEMLLLAELEKANKKIIELQNRLIRELEKKKTKGN